MSTVVRLDQMPAKAHTVSSAIRLAVSAMRKRPKLAALFLTATVIQGFLQGLLVWGLRQVLLSFEKHSGVLNSLWLSAAFILTLWVIRAACTDVGEVSAAKLSHGIEVDTMQGMLAKLMRLSVRFFDKSGQGDLVMTTYSDASHVRLVTLALGDLLLHATRLTGLAAVAWIMSPKLTVIGLVAVPLGAWPALWLGEHLQLASRVERGTTRNLYESFLQISSGIRVIKVNEAEHRVLAQARSLGTELYKALVRQAKMRSLSRFLLEAASGVGLTIILLVGGADVAAGRLQWQSLLSLLLALMGVYGPTVGILQVFLRMKSSIPHLDRIERLREVVPEIQDRSNARRLSKPPGTIELRDVSFRYEDSIVLDGISTTFRQGETIGIVGPSGAGKTTLLSLILRLYDPSGGAILIDGVDLREIRHADLLHMSAIVLQEPFLFIDTVANNIRAARPDASIEEVIAAAKAANIHDEIMAMEQGYDTLLGRSELARGVSTGQKQRICIAAALFKNTPLLFLDEATSNLDSVSERKLQAALERLMEGRTTFVIAHRLSTLRAADRILVLEQGRVVGNDGHEVLMETCETYRRLWLYQNAAEAALEALRPAAAATGTEFQANEEI